MTIATGSCPVVISVGRSLAIVSSVEQVCLLEPEPFGGFGAFRTIACLIEAVLHFLERTDERPLVVFDVLGRVSSPGTQTGGDCYFW